MGKKILKILSNGLLFGLVFSLALATSVMAQSQNGQTNSDFLVMENSQKTVHAGYENSILKELGLPEPPVSKIALTKYRPVLFIAGLQEIVEEEFGIHLPADIVGMYDYGRYKTILVQKDKSFLLIQVDGEEQTSSTKITPTLLGQKKTFTSKIESGRSYSIDREILTEVYRISFPRPDDPSIAQQTDIVKISRTDVYRNLAGETITTLVTAGDFYVDYGNSVTSIIDKSSHRFEGIYGSSWSMCDFSSTSSGAGTTSGQLKTRYKAGTIAFRVLFEIWESCDAWENVDNGGSTNSWVSTHTPPDSCTD